MDHLKAVEIIKDRLYWISDKAPPKDQSNAFFFNIDNDLVYEPFFADFGPLDLGKTYRFVTELDKLLQDNAYSKSKFFHHTSIDNAKRANAACLMGCFQVIMLGRTAEEAWAPFANVQPALAEFRDASYTNSAYRCSTLDVLRGLEYAIKLKWFDVKKFNLRDYEFYEKVDNGDLNWTVPGKFVSFSGPSSVNRDADGYKRFTPEDYVPIFRKQGVTMVVRLNNAQYEKDRFTKNGIKHKDIYFLDGSCPKDELIDEFIATAEAEKGALAVHCKAGLGRTGSMIACYVMKHYKFPAPDLIGWLRLARPGTVLGPQQQFLCDKQAAMFKRNDQSAIFKTIYPLVKEFWERRENPVVEEMQRLQLVDKSPGMSHQDKQIAEHGDLGQANRLLAAKYSGKSGTGNLDGLNSAVGDSQARHVKKDSYGGVSGSSKYTSGNSGAYRK